MSETLRGTEALLYAPLTDVVLPFDKAIALLTDRTRSAYAQNIDLLISNIDPGDPNAPIAIELLIATRENRDAEVLPGGFSMKDTELAQIYEQGTQATFRDVMNWYATELFPKFLNNPTVGRAPGVVCMGYILDAIAILKLDIASFGDGVAVIIDVARHEGKEFSPFVFGCMVEDAEKLRTGLSLEAEFLMGKDEVLLFQHEYFARLHLSEKMAYLHGYAMQREEMVTALKG